jgi:hypothetical protein
MDRLGISQLPIFLEGFKNTDTPQPMGVSQMILS